MYTRKSLAEYVAKRQEEQFAEIDKIAYENKRQKDHAKEVVAYQNTHFYQGLKEGYFLGLQDAGEIMVQRQLPWRTGKTKAARILAEIQWGDGDTYYEVLYFHPFQGLRYPEGYYDNSGENVPDSAIKKFVEF